MSRQMHAMIGGALMMLAGPGAQALTCICLPPCIPSCLVIPCCQPGMPVPVVDDAKNAWIEAALIEWRRINAVIADEGIAIGEQMNGWGLGKERRTSIISGPEAKEGEGIETSVEWEKITGMEAVERARWMQKTLIKMAKDSERLATELSAAQEQGANAAAAARNARDIRDWMRRITEVTAARSRVRRIALETSATRVALARVLRMNLEEYTPRFKR